MRDLLSLSLLNILPSSISSDDTVIAAAKALDGEFQDATKAIESVAIIPNIRNIVDSALIDLLAWQFHTDFYDPTLPLETRRDLVLKALLWHFRKGTPAVVEEIVRTVYKDAKVTEWFEYGGDPYFFRVSTLSEVTDPADIDVILKAVWAVKNTRSWLEFIQAVIESWLLLYHGVGLYCQDEVSVGIRPREVSADRPLQVVTFGTEHLRYTIEVM